MKTNGKTLNLHLPVEVNQIRDLKIGDQIYLSGIICTGRDQVHKKILEYQKNGENLPESFKQLEGSAIYHMGPIMKENTDGTYKLISGGPTTSARMNPFQTKVNDILKIGFVIGKGGMSDVDWSTPPTVYLQYPGGAGALVSKFVEKVTKVEWIELGPEAAWFLEVKNFGPLLVAIDCDGSSLYDTTV